MKIPSTIYNPNAFDSSPAAGFDGAFFWEWTEGCFGTGSIAPMDFDAVVERNGNFIVFETKKRGVVVPQGQLITLDTAYSLNCFTIVFIHGKEKPESMCVWHAPDFRTGQKMQEEVPVTVTQARKFVSEWYEYANKNGKRGDRARWSEVIPRHVNDDLIEF